MHFAGTRFYRSTPAPHNAARHTYINIGGVIQPAPAPRFSNHIADQPQMSGTEGSDTQTVLSAFGFDEAEIRILKQVGALP